MSRMQEEVGIQSQMCSLAAALPQCLHFRALPFPPPLWEVPGMAFAQSQRGWLIRAEIAAEIEAGGGAVLVGERSPTSSEIQAADPS